MYTKGKDPAKSALCTFWWAYIEGALNTDLKTGEAVDAMYAGSGGGFWVVEDVETAEIVGCVGCEILATPPGTAELRRMSVSPGCRGRGIAKLLVRVVEEHASVAGCNAVVLTTGSIMVPAFHLYTSAGYEHFRKGFMPPERRSALAASGDEDLYEAAFRKPITPNNQGRWMWSPHGCGKDAAAARTTDRTRARLRLQTILIGIGCAVAGMLVGQRMR